VINLRKGGEKEFRGEERGGKRKEGRSIYTATLLQFQLQVKVEQEKERGRDPKGKKKKERTGSTSTNSYRRRN